MAWSPGRKGSWKVGAILNHFQLAHVIVASKAWCGSRTFPFHKGFLPYTVQLPPPLVKAQPRHGSAKLFVIARQRASNAEDFPRVLLNSTPSFFPSSDSNRS